MKETNRVMLQITIVSLLYPSKNNVVFKIIIDLPLLVGCNMFSGSIRVLNRKRKKKGEIVC